MARIKTALISVSDKTGLLEFARRLVALGVEILATGGTARLLRESGIQVQDVSEYTGYPEILDGRIKTLHPKVYGGLLARREQAEHVQQMKEHGIRPIDMVVVNLYPFAEVISEPGVELIRAIENIDIGGPTMIRAAAKNYTHVAVVTNPNTYSWIAKEMERTGGSLSEQTHFSLAVDAFHHTAHYDTAIADYLAGMERAQGRAPRRLTMEYIKRQQLRYGENPHQAGAFFVEERIPEPCMANAEQVSGLELSFNNVLDCNAGIELAKEFDGPAAMLIKHTNPCGAGTADSLCAAYKKAYLCDPVNASGCVVVLNRPLDVCTAEAIAEVRATVKGKPAPYFVEVLVAPGFDDDALNMLHAQTGWASRIRILKAGPLNRSLVDETAKDGRRIVGGVLIQDRDLLGFDPQSNKVVTALQPTEQQMQDLRFAWLCCKHVKSSAVVLARDQGTVGVGPGQISRADAAAVALRKAGDRAQGAVMAADAFIPSPDLVEQAARAGVKAIIQPGGTPDDAAVFEAANRLGLAMVITGTRHLRH